MLIAHHAQLNARNCQTQRLRTNWSDITLAQLNTQLIRRQILLQYYYAVTM